MEENEYVELDEHRAIMYLPVNAVKVDISATVFLNGELKKVSMSYGMEEIREMFRKADDGYIDEDDVFTLTDKGRQLSETGNGNE